MREGYQYYTYQKDVRSTKKISDHRGIERIPDVCPICDSGIEPELHYSITIKHELQVAMRCPRESCGKMFISIYKSNILAECYPVRYKERTFSDEITRLSPQFVDIYNQSLEAESLGLHQICGVGYRKSLEFLIKDYLILVKPEKESEIKSNFLGKCINEEIENQNLKDISNRANWIGNDETHYERRWESKDIADLKNLIDVTLHWVSMELLTKQYVEEMN
jgi:hypothetical protein